MRSLSRRYTVSQVSPTRTCRKKEEEGIPFRQSQGTKCSRGTPLCESLGIAAQRAMWNTKSDWTGIVQKPIRMNPLQTSLLMILKAIRLSDGDTGNHSPSKWESGHTATRVERNFYYLRLLCLTGWQTRCITDSTCSSIFSVTSCTPASGLRGVLPMPRPARATRGATGETSWRGQDRFRERGD